MKMTADLKRRSLTLEGHPGHPTAISGIISPGRRRELGVGGMNGKKGKGGQDVAGQKT